MGVKVDGLEVFADACKKHGVDILTLIADTARWVAPETFELLPVWYPETYRTAPMYKANWVDRQTNANQLTGETALKPESNERANKALKSALGGELGKNWTSCHLWGIDDGSANVIVRDPRYYTCVANMIALPTPLKAATDAMPDVKYALRFCCYFLYGWFCDHESVRVEVAKIKAGQLPANYPECWPRPGHTNVRPPGLAPLSKKIRTAAEKRLEEIKNDLADPSLTHYPRESVNSVLAHYKKVS